MLFPYAQKNPPDSFPAVTVILMALNVIIFFLTSEGGVIRMDILDAGGISSVNFSPLRLITSAFLHAEPVHLLGNVWFLWLFGVAVEGRLRTWRFLALYCLCALGAAALQSVISPGDVPMIGASGAIMGVMGAALYLFPFAKVKVFYWFFIVLAGTWLVPMWGVAIYYVSLDLFWGFLGMASEMEGGTAHFAHLGGVIMGVVVPMILRVQRDSVHVSYAKETLSDMKDFGALTPYQLFDLVQSRPDDSELANAWMSAELQHGMVSPECLAHYQRHLPKLAREGEIRDVGLVANNLVAKGHFVNPGAMGIIARRCEDERYVNYAMVLYDQVIRSGQSSDSDREMAVFRLASLHERSGDGTTAGNLYRIYLRDWPFGMMEQQVKLGLSRLSSRSS